MKLVKLSIVTISISLAVLSCRNSDDDNFSSHIDEPTFLKSVEKDGIENSQQNITDPKMDTIRSGGYRLGTDSTSLSRKIK